MILLKRCTHASSDPYAESASFHDLEPHRFEDLVRQLAYDFKDWRSIEAIGRSGSDEGIDIRAWERVGKFEVPEREQENEQEPEEDVIEAGWRGGWKRPMCVTDRVDAGGRRGARRRSASRVIARACASRTSSCGSGTGRWTGW